jgi:serine acetyltransferase
MSSRLMLRLHSKLGWLARRAALTHPHVVAASRGLEGVLRLLEDSDGDDACGLLQAMGARIGGGTRILRGLVLHNADPGFAHLQIGERCHIGRQVLIDLAAPVTFGERVTVSMRCSFITHTDVGDSRCGIPPSRAAIELGDDVYIGAGALVLPGVVLGARSVVGAGAVVTHSVAPGACVVGVPARPLLGSAAQTAQIKRGQTASS